MDNLRPHRATEVRDLLDRAGIGLLYLPRYSPEFNPIEPAWAKVKERLEAKAARSLEALEAELKPALDTITAKDARGWIRHAGYALHSNQKRFSRTLSNLFGRLVFVRATVLVLRSTADGVRVCPHRPFLATHQGRRQGQ